MRGLCFFFLCRGNEIIIIFARQNSFCFASREIFILLLQSNLFRLMVMRARELSLSLNRCEGCNAAILTFQFSRSGFNNLLTIKLNIFARAKQTCVVCRLYNLIAFDCRCVCVVSRNYARKSNNYQKFILLYCVRACTVDGKQLLYAGRYVRLFILHKWHRRELQKGGTGGGT